MAPSRSLETCRSGSHGLASPNGYGWVREHALPEGRWRLSQQLLDRVPGLLEGAAAERPFVFVSRRQVRRLNSTQFASAPAPACIHLHPDDAVELGVGEGDLLEIHNDHGRTQGLPVRLDPTTRRGVVSVSHGWYGANVSRLVSTVQDLDPLTGQPVMSALRVSLHPSTDSGAPDEQKFR